MPSPPRSCSWPIWLPHCLLDITSIIGRSKLGSVMDRAISSVVAAIIGWFCFAGLVHIEGASLAVLRKL